MRLWTETGEVLLTDEEQRLLWAEAVQAAADLLITDLEQLALASR